MAKQNSNPEPWSDDMSDGCTGVFDFYYHEACVRHDEAYHWGGSSYDKFAADDDLAHSMCNTPGIGGWLARRGWADIRYAGVRGTTFNYPPGTKQRDIEEFDIRFEAFNWLGSPQHRTHKTNEGDDT